MRLMAGHTLQRADHPIIMLQAFPLPFLHSSLVNFQCPHSHLLSLQDPCLAYHHRHRHHPQTSIRSSPTLFRLCMVSRRMRSTLLEAELIIKTSPGAPSRDQAMGTFLRDRCKALAWIRDRFSKDTIKGAATCRTTGEATIKGPTIEEATEEPASGGTIEDSRRSHGHGEI